MNKERFLKLVSEIIAFTEKEEYSEKVKFFLEEFVAKIKSVCKRQDFPEELEYLAKKYVINNLSALDKNGDYGNGKSEISSMSDNGQTITLTNNTSLKKEDIDLSLFIEKNKAEIAQYAYMGW